MVASEYLASLYKGISTADVKRVCSDPQGYDRLVEEQTPGGFNAQLVQQMRDAGVYDAYVKGLDSLMDQLSASTNKSDKKCDKKRD